MLFRNLLLGSFLLAATALAQPADSTTKKTDQQSGQITISSTTNKQEITSIKKQQTVSKPTTSWTKIKALFE